MKIEHYLKYLQKTESIFPMDNLHKGSKKPLMNSSKDKDKNQSKKDIE